MLKVDDDIQRIFELMAELDELAFTHEPNLGKDADWLPESPEGKAIFARLTASENRPALRRWYARHQDVELNPSALKLKLSLERAIDEQLA